MPKIHSQPPAVDLMELVGLFYPPDQRLAEFTPILDSRLMPEPERGLLDHEAHMTVTVEAFHGSAVDVHVARTRRGTSDASGADGRWYAREITLHRQSDGRAVQYGIVRLAVDLLAPQVWDEINSQRTPLGRVLIKHQVLREVELCGLWKVVAQRPLATLLDIPPGQVTYGRTARIFCDHRPAIELLEIVAPDEDP